MTPDQDATTPRRLRLPLTTSEQVRNELCRVYRQVRAGKVSTSDGEAMAGILKSILIASGNTDRNSPA